MPRSTDILPAVYVVVLVAMAAIVAGAGTQTSGTQTVQLPTATTTAGNVSGTIRATGQFQQLWSANISRHDCTIINTGTNLMHVSEGLGIAGDGTGRPAATILNTVPVYPSWSYGCAAPGAVLTGQINITGNEGDTFYAAQY